MDDLGERLEAWVRAGLVSSEQANAIAAHESHDATPDRHEPARAGGRRGILAEAVGYVGAALALGALAAILTEVWDDLTVAGELTLVALLGVVLAGAALALSSAPSAALARLTSLLWAGVAVSAAWFAGLVAAEIVDADAAVTGLAVGGAALLVALPVLLLRPSIPAQLAALASVVITAVAAVSLPDLAPEPMWYGWLVWGIAVAWWLLASGRWIRPPLSAEVLGAVLALIGNQVATVGDHRVAALLVGVATAAVLVGLAVRADGVHHLIIGALGLFVFVPQLVFEVFGDAIGAPATLLVVGLLLVLLAVGLGRAGREVRREAGGGR